MIFAHSLVFRSIRAQISSGLAATPSYQPTPFFEQIAEDERIWRSGYAMARAALLLCHQRDTQESRLFVPSHYRRPILFGHHQWVRPLSCWKLPNHGRVILQRLLIFHDLSFAEARAKEIGRYAVLALSAW